jgi:hypothetical protein
MAFVIAPSISYTAEMRSADVIGIRRERASNWGLDGLIAGGILLSPVLAFLVALVVDIVIGFLNDGSVPALHQKSTQNSLGNYSETITPHSGKAPDEKSDCSERSRMSRRRLRIENPADDRAFFEIPMRGTTRELA